MEVTNDETIADMPDSLAALLIKHQGWRPATDEDRARFAALEASDEQPEPEPAPEPEPEPAPVKKRTPAKPKPEPEPEPEPAAQDDDGLDPAAACDDDLPEGITFAASAYTTVIDEKTGEKIKVLKTHCVNKHEYSPDNTKIRVRDSKAHRECQTCLKGRRARAVAKKAGQKQ